MTCYALTLYLTSKNYDRNGVEAIFGVGFVCLWIMLGTVVLLLIQYSEARNEVTIRQLREQLKEYSKD